MSPFSLPPDVGLADLHQYANKVLKAAVAGEPRVLAWFADYSKEPSLTSAQLLVALEYGFSSWGKLKQRVERNAADPANAAIRRARRRRGQIPQDEGCGVVPVELVAATSPRFSFGMTAVRVYSETFVVEFQWVNRRTTEARSEWQWLIRSVFVTPFAPLPGADAERAVVTAEYADGRSVSNRGGGWVGPMRAFPGVELPVLSFVGGPGHAVKVNGSQAWHSSGGLRLSPLPPPGELRLTFDWPRFGVRDVRVVLDAGLIRAAARRVRRFPGGDR